MIYDSIKNIGRYKGISTHLDKAIAFVEEQDLYALPLGKTEIDGDKVFINVMEAMTQPEQKLHFEVHKRYMDIQIDLEGTEVIAIGLGKQEEIVPYDDAKDIGFYDAEVSSPCIMGPGRFIVCMAEELHKPGMAYGSEACIKKCVIKVAVEE